MNGFADQRRIDTAKSDENLKIWNPLFINVFVINILTNLCTFMINTLSAKYADYLGAPATIVGLVTGLFALTALIFKIIAAPAIDSFNRKYILAGSLIILFASFVGYTFSKTIPMLIVSRLLTGAGMAFSTTGLLTIASDSLPQGKMSSGIAYFSLGMAVCMAIGPTVGLKLVERVGYTYTFMICAFIILLSTAYTVTMRYAHKQTTRFRITFSSIIAVEAILPAVMLYTLATSFSVIHAFLVLYAEGAGVGSDIGYFFTVYAAAMIFTRPLIGKLADRHGTVTVVIPSLICFAGSFLLISFSRTLPMFLVAGVVASFGFGGCQPALLAVSMKSVPKEKRGAASCTSYVGMDLGVLTGPVVAGVIVERLGYVSMWRFMIVPIIAALAFGILFRNRINNPGGKPASPKTGEIEHSPVREETP
ncbi:MAG: MFS transporter [Spirochaetales bacterium]|nr:MFS transporter [Spirochaetales bacterium]